MYNINDELEAAMKEFGGGSGSSSTFYKVQEGNNNVVRVLTEGKTYAVVRMGIGEYRTLYGREKGDPLRSRDDWDYEKSGRLPYPVSGEDEKETRASIRSIYYVIDRNDGKIKQAEFSYSVAKALGELQTNPDYKFDDMPMPYDVRITYNKKNPPASMYQVAVRPGGPAPTKEQLEDLAKKQEKYSPEQVVEHKKRKQIEEDEKRGLRLSETEVKKAMEEWRENANIEAAKQSSGDGLPDIVYPTDDINPEDIPF